MDIASVSAETRKRLYDLMDTDRSIAEKVWNLRPLTEYETFIAKALGYLVDKPKAEGTAATQEQLQGKPFLQKSKAEKVKEDLRRWREAQHQRDVDNRATETHNNLVRKQRGD